jgi:hypothetical protein
MAMWSIAAAACLIAAPVRQRRARGYSGEAPTARRLRIGTFVRPVRGGMTRLAGRVGGLFVAEFTIADRHNHIRLTRLSRVAPRGQLRSRSLPQVVEPHLVGHCGLGKLELVVAVEPGLGVLELRGEAQQQAVGGEGADELDSEG